MGIERQVTEPHSPHQNGVAERKNRTLLERARCLMVRGSLPNFLWSELVATANFLINRTPTRANQHVTPFQQVWRHRPNLSSLCIIGSTIFVKSTEPNIKKLAPRAYKCVLVGYDLQSVGYDLQSAAYWCYHPPSRWVLVSSNVRIHEGDLYYSTLTVPSPAMDTLVFSWPESSVFSPIQSADIALTDAPPFVNPPSPPPVAPASPQFDPFSVAATSPDVSPSHNPDTTSDATSPLPIRTYTRRPPHAPLLVPLFPSLPSPRRSARPIVGRLPSSLHDYFLGQAEAVSEPTNFATAYSHPGWRMAMQTEFLSIQRNITWTLVDLPPSRRAITTKWVFKAKPNPNGTTAKLKARLVARGFQQRAGIDFTETFAPVAKTDTFQTLVAVCGHHGWPIYHLDVKSAFLNGEILEEVYVHQPQGFTEPDRESQVCLLKKTLYGLRQAPRVWHTKFDACLQDLGLVKSQFDPNLYIFHDGSLIAMLLLYVDDVYLAGSHSDKIAWLR